MQHTHGNNPFVFDRSHCDISLQKSSMTYLTEFAKTSLRQQHLSLQFPWWNPQPQRKKFLTIKANT